MLWQGEDGPCPAPPQATLFRRVATAAARRAHNAKDFLVPAQGILSQKIEVLDQEAEARLVSIGLMSNFNINDGLIADLGGGSLELIGVKNGEPVHSNSLNLGHLSIKTAQLQWIYD